MGKKVSKKSGKYTISSEELEKLKKRMANKKFVIEEALISTEDLEKQRTKKEEKTK